MPIDRIKGRKMDRNNKLGSVWQFIANRGLQLIAKGRASTATGLAALARDLLSERGEASGIVLAQEFADYYRRLSDEARRTFFLSLLAPEFLPDPLKVVSAAEKYRAAPNSETLAELFIAAESLRQELFRRVNSAPGGTLTLVAMREDLLRMLPEQPTLKPVDIDLRHLFGSWFNRGFLRVQRIDWSTPALVLEKLIEHEAVHEIAGWDDLRRRLAQDRRCFAFFHPALPNEPLIFVEVALTRGLPSSVHELLDRNVKALEPERSDTAVFYSISNCLGGLRGIPFGNLLIKQVVTELQSEGLALRSFVTLSPVPGFRSWLNGLSHTRKVELLTPADTPGLDSIAVDNWHAKPRLRDRARPVLLRLCAQYLLSERKHGRALDPVAAFHLGNGASVEQINWLADSSDKGMARSFGIMVNYAYRPGHIERNHEAYVKHGHISASANVKELLTARRES